MDRAEAAVGLKYGDPLVAIEMIHSDQLAAEAYVRGRRGGPRPAVDALRRKGH